jgi:vacuolar-type H+-ATPase subunit B/Vma2
MSIVETTVHLFKEMATFEEAGRIRSIVQLPVCTMPEYSILPVLSFNF